MRARTGLLAVGSLLTLAWALSASDAGSASLAGLAKDQGSGSRFTLQSQGSTFDLNVGLVKVDAAANRAVIEVYAADQFSAPLWQQFTLDVKGTRPAVESGYIQVGNKAPMTLPKQYLSGIGNLDVGMFLLSEADLRAGSGKDLKSLGQETITIAAGTVTCLHYRVEKDGQTLDFWASDEAKPIGLVRMVSAGKKKEENYQLELQELLSGIAAKIDPSKAGPLSDDMKAILTKR
ncbi:MAG: hypothetical protein ACKOCD_03060 [Nitrospiraceae bacterium]